MPYRDTATPFIAFTGGEDDYAHLFAGGSTEVAGVNLLLGFRHDRTDGPWDLAEDLRKYNAVARWSRETDTSGLSIDVMGYKGDWTATDQIRNARLTAVSSIVSDTSIPATAATRIATRSPPRVIRKSAYALDYRLDLYFDFTHALKPVGGDQFEQEDKCHVFGGAFRSLWAVPKITGAWVSTCVTTTSLPSVFV